jgi:hypothetical protein
MRIHNNSGPGSKNRKVIALEHTPDENLCYFYDLSYDLCSLVC